MLNHRKISEKEYQQVEKTIQNRKEECVMELRRKDEEDEDYDDFFWPFTEISKNTLWAQTHRAVLYGGEAGIWNNTINANLCLFVQSGFSSANICPKCTNEFNLVRVQSKGTFKRKGIS